MWPIKIMKLAVGNGHVDIDICNQSCHKPMKEANIAISYKSQLKGVRAGLEQWAINVSMEYTTENKSKQNFKITKSILDLHTASILKETWVVHHFLTYNLSSSFIYANPCALYNASKSVFMEMLVA